MELEVNPSNRSKVMGSYKEKVSNAERDLKRAMTALSDSAAAREELFSYDGTNEDQVCPTVPERRSMCWAGGELWGGCVFSPNWFLSFLFPSSSFL